MLVTVGTEGPIDYLEYPDGRRETLGRVSVLEVISLSSSNRDKALKEFEANGRCMVNVREPSKLQEYLEKGRFPMRRSLRVRLAAIQSAADEIQEALSQGQDVPTPLVDQLQEATEQFTQECGQCSSTAGDLKAAEQTLALLQRTASKIDRLETRGKRFRADRARMDIHTLASQASAYVKGHRGIDIQAVKRDAVRVARLFP